MKKRRVCHSLAVLLAVLLPVLLLGCGKKETEDEKVAGEAVVSQSPGPERSQDDTLQIQVRKENENKKAQEQAQSAQTEPAGNEEQPQQAAAQEDGLTEPEEQQNVEPEKDTPEQSTENKLQIVFLGDSIIDNHRDGTGVAYLTGVACNANVYNLAMGGTSAALTTYESSEYENWKARNLNGVVNVINGNVDPGLLDGYRAGEIYQLCDFGKTDYFVIEYGLNDYFSAIPLSNPDKTYDLYTYAGALRVAISDLRAHFPEATVVLCSPNYAQFFSGNQFLGDGNVVNNGGGTLAEYYRVCGNISSEYNTLFLNAYEGIGLDAYTAEEYLEDGVHLSEKGRQVYADALSKLILDYEAQKNN